MTEEKIEETKKEDNSELEKKEELLKREEDLIEKEEAIMQRKEDLKEKKQLGGNSEAGQITPKKEPLSPEEYSEALERGEVNPLKEDGYI